MFQEFLTIESQGINNLSDGLLKGKESKADLKPPDEEQIKAIGLRLGNGYEIKAMGLSWGEVEVAALDRIGWGRRVEASCSVRS